MEIVAFDILIQCSGIFNALAVFNDLHHLAACIGPYFELVIGSLDMDIG